MSESPEGSSSPVELEPGSVKNPTALPFSVLVTGDPVVHWMQVMGPAGESARPAAGNADFLRVWSRTWGAALLGELLGRGDDLIDKEREAGASWIEQTDLTVRQRELSADALAQINFASVVRDYALWGEDDKGVCRMQRFLFRQDADGHVTNARSPWGEVNATASEIAQAPNCLIIDDIGRGFRVEPDWPPPLRVGAARFSGPLSERGRPAMSSDPTWQPERIILKTAGPLQDASPVSTVRPLLDSPLWNFLITDHCDRLTVYCKVDSLRQANFVPISLPLSWERTANDIVKAVTGSKLARARRVVVSVGLGGAVIIEREKDPILLFDENNQEGDFERRFDGQPIGLGRYIVAAMAIAAGQEDTEKKLATADKTAATTPKTAAATAHGKRPWPVVGVERGLNAARGVHEDGYGSRRVRPTFASQRAVRWLCGDSRLGKSPFYYQTIGIDNDWRLLGPASKASYFKRAQEWVEKGDVAGDPFPIEKMGDWMSVDRDEIESIRSIKNIVREYLAKPYKSDKPPAPLNLAVFGQPGSGKSYAVKQMIEEMEKQKREDSPAVKFHQFNLAQFASIGDLPDMLHAVRDIALGGKTPVVFWDEFDTTVEGRRLGWLAPFLQPMQDGLFLDGGKERPIGRAIFVFAGGVFQTMSGFREYAAATAHGSGDGQSAAAPPAKATDFLSRLRGYVDILGPNPVHFAGKTDATYMLRRALLLRGVLLRDAKHLVEKRDGKDHLQIDGGVLNAFLSISAYSHGSRSMEALISMSALSGKKSFEKSSLPALHQINLHVDAAEFLRLVEANLPASAASGWRESWVSRGAEQSER